MVRGTECELRAEVPGAKEEFLILEQAERRARNRLEDQLPNGIY